MQTRQTVKIALILLVGVLLGLGGGYVLFYSAPAERGEALLSPEFFVEEGEDVEEGARAESLSVLSSGSEAPAVAFKASPVAPLSSANSSPRDICVSVEGAVRRPGVYCFEKDSRVNDAVKAAGGLQENADLGDINLAGWLLDNVPLYIPFQRVVHKDEHGLVARQSPVASQMNPPQYTRSGWSSSFQTAAQAGGSAWMENDGGGKGTSSLPVSSSSPETSGKVNLNTATLAELQTLPGIGPKTAAQIEAYREGQPFRSVEELQQVHGIGVKKLEAVRDLVTVD